MREDLKKRSNLFAHNCVKLALELPKNKLGIVIEEADECIFWVDFLQEEKLINNTESQNILNESKELTAIFIASRITAIKNMKS